MMTEALDSDQQQVTIETGKIKDADQRAQALDPTRSYICEAPAGSGKTELLTQRVLTLLARVSRPEEVLAITFTRKATAEMRERILHALHEAKGPKPASSHHQMRWQLARAVLANDAEKQWQLLDNPNRLQIRTFDGLCARLAQAMPFESSLGAQPGISDDINALYRRAVQRLWESMESDMPWSESLAVLMSRLDNHYPRFERLMIQLLEQREAWLPLIHHEEHRDGVRDILEANLTTVIEDAIQRIHERVPEALQREWLALAAYAASNIKLLGIPASPLADCADIDMQYEQLPGSDELSLRQWHGLLFLVMTKDRRWRKRADKNLGFPSIGNAAERKAQKEQKVRLSQMILALEEIPGLHDALQDVFELPLWYFPDTQWSLLDALFDVLPIATAQLLLVFKEANAVDFTEISLRARQALQDLESPTELALKLDYQLQHILVDEFQDTSITQVELLSLLVEGWQPDDGRTLFCVGDAMQSIYGFRGANVGLFLHCKQHGLAHIPLKPLRLTTNFRSQAGLVQWVNHTFSQSFPNQDDISTGAIRYNPSDAHHDKQDGQAVWVHGFVDPANESDEARTVLDIVQNSWQDDPNASIAILVRNKAHAAHILPLFRDAKLRYQALELEALSERSVIQDLLALLRSMLHPADRIAAMAVLRAPWCSLSLVDMEALATFLGEAQQMHASCLNEASVFSQAQGLLALSLAASDASILSDAEPSIEGLWQQQDDLFGAHEQKGSNRKRRRLSQDGIERLQRVLGPLIAAQENKERKALRDELEGLWIRLGGPACVEQTVDLNNAQVFFECLERWPYAAALPSFAAVNDAVMKLNAQVDPQADGRLQIMTIHKSKGLEFDVVVVPALHRQPRRSDVGLLMWHERLSHDGDKILLMSPMTPTGEEASPTEVHMRAQTSKKEIYENGRLLYVACTRAKRQLHLSMHVKEEADDAARLKKPAKQSLASTVWSAVQTRLKRYEAGTKELSLPPSTTGERALKPLSRLSAAWVFPHIEGGSILSKYVPRYDYQDDDNEESITRWQSPSARHIGTLLHIGLQQMAEQGVATWSHNPWDESYVVSRLRAMGVPMPELAQATKKVLMAIDTVLSDQKARWLLSDDHAECHSEYALTFIKKNETINVVMDRLFVTAEGVTWIVDYKSSEPESGQSLDDFLKQERQQYLPQLVRYRQAALAAGFQNVREALYFPLLACWYELE